MISRVMIVVPPLVNMDEPAGLNPDRPDFEAHRLVSPVEPTTVAADLLARGFDVRIFDLGTYPTGRYESLERELISCRPDAIAIVQSILTFATAQDWDGKSVFDVARRVSPSVVTLLSGIHATNYPGRAVADGVCDFSIRGEVDFAIGDLLVALNDGQGVSSVAGLSYRDGNEVRTSQRYPEVDVSQLPVPAYYLLDAEQKRRYTMTLERGKIRFPEKSPRYRDIMTSRGCVLRCSFCSVAYLRGETQRYRRKPLTTVMAEIESALEDGIEEIHFFDDLFVESEAQILRFTEELVRRKLRFHWFVAQGMPLWPLTSDALAAMAETGMYRIICPLESGSNRVLKKVVGKAFSTAEHHHDVLRWARERDIEIIGMFVVGMPGETRQEILETVEFAEDHPEIDYSVFSIATPMVGTRLMKLVTRAGQLEDAETINRVIKRTVALYHTEAFSPYEMGVIRAFDWDRINFPTAERQAKYAQMVGITRAQLDELREHSKKTFHRFFPDYDGPLSFKDLYGEPGLFRGCEPIIPQTLY